MEEWDDQKRRSPALVMRILDQLAQAGVEGTFFVLGWLAAREPGVVRAIVAAGHEVASHGWNHQKVTRLSPESFRDQVRRSKALLEDLTGQPCLGYRAPSFSIIPGQEWALDVLLEEGYAYDSSIYPVELHPDYGYPDAQRDPHVLKREGGDLVEIPPATWRVGSINLPAAGGAYLRFFPVTLIKNALASAEKRGKPGTLYLHPWEFDDGMPAIPAPWKTRLRMTGGIPGVAGKMAALTDGFEFRPMIETAKEMFLLASDMMEEVDGFRDEDASGDKLAT
jgi:polysaccharide deacetylase family protein (PEP-CTERM system associated)